MTQMEIHSPTRVAINGYKVDVSRGQSIGRVSSEWFNRPADERYLSLTDLHNSVKRRSERSKTRIIESEATRAPFGPVTPAIREGLIAHARRRNPLILSWREQSAS